MSGGTRDCATFGRTSMSHESVERSRAITIADWGADERRRVRIMVAAPDSGQHHDSRLAGGCTVDNWPCEGVPAGAHRIIEAHVLNGTGLVRAMFEEIARKQV